MFSNFSGFISSMEKFFTASHAPGTAPVIEAEAGESAVHRFPNPVEDEEQDPEVLQEEDPEDNQGEDEEESASTVLDRFAAGKSLFVPSELQREMWGCILRLEPEYGEEAWMNLKVAAIVKKWTGHPDSAVTFSAPAPDKGLRPLKFNDHKEMEKKLVTLQSTAGGAGAICTRMLLLLEGRLCIARLSLSLL